MALEEYKKKRDFRRTPEPAGTGRKAAKRASAPLSFVVQKHAARRLHYDFRLELDGVLKSWAVPKGPSLDPGEKRLAIHVEDHPIEYGGFEGVIPEGQYGGGTVMLWDRGTWTPLDPDPDAAYGKGTLKFRLDGKKLHGNWALVRIRGKRAGDRQENWLLIKERDAVAAPESGSAIVDDNPLSVATGRSLDAIAADRDRVWDGAQGEITAPRPAARKRRKPPEGARKAALPDRVAPQLATSVDEAPAGDQWLNEIKYDGDRLLARIDHGEVRLITRNGLDWTGKFPAQAQALARLPADTALLDGELVALAADGTTSFAELQDRIGEGTTDGLVYVAFDLLYRDGFDLQGVAQQARKEALAEIVAPEAAGIVRYSDHHIGRGPDFFRHACRLGLEGIVAKRRDRPYRPGRSRDWLKVKCINRDEFVIVGFSDPAGSRAGFGALLLGYYDRAGSLRYAGRVGTGFSSPQLVELRRQLDALERPDPPLALPKGVSRKGVHWIEPRLVAEIHYSQWTDDGLLRHPAFQGLREDKSAAEVVYDPPQGGAAAAADREPPKPAGAAAAAASDRPRPARDGSVSVAGVRLTHPERILYPEEGITKLALARYYEAIGDWALPHLAHRPLTLVRCPEGQGKPCFYQKHITAGVPDALGRVEITEDTGTGTYLVVENLAGLVALVQMAVLEIHPWGSTVKKLETPDRITFDFDPDVGLPWARVSEAAIAMREALLGIGLASFAKTTGGKGLHVVVPIAPKLEWNAAREFTKWVAERFVAAYPELYTSNMAKRARTGRIFIDYLRNARGATAVGAYSPRARPGAPVATPLAWDEVEAGTGPESFTVATLPDRLARLKSDPWAGIATISQSIPAKVRRAIGI